MLFIYNSNVYVYKSLNREYNDAKITKSHLVSKNEKHENVSLIT
jgi:hypothetical protein